MTLYIFKVLYIYDLLQPCFAIKLSCVSIAKYCKIELREIFRRFVILTKYVNPIQYNILNHCYFVSKNNSKY